MSNFKKLLCFTLNYRNDPMKPNWFTLDLLLEASDKK